MLILHAEVLLSSRFLNVEHASVYICYVGMSNSRCLIPTKFSILLQMILLLPSLMQSTNIHILLQYDSDISKEYRENVNE